MKVKVSRNIILNINEIMVELDDSEIERIPTLKDGEYIEYTSDRTYLVIKKQ